MSNINENELVKTLTKCSLHVRTYLVIFYVPAFNEFGSFADLISSCCADKEDTIMLKIFRLSVLDIE